MKYGVNRVTLVGNVGDDPRISERDGEAFVANFPLATNEFYKNREGEEVNRTEWHRIVAWGRLGEICGEYLSKGRQVYIEGKLQTRQWEKDGVTRYTTEVVASDMKMLGSKTQGDGYQPSNSSKAAEYSGPPLPTTQDDDDIPF